MRGLHLLLLMAGASAVGDAHAKQEKPPPQPSKAGDDPELQETLVRVYEQELATVTVDPSTITVEPRVEPVPEKASRARARKKRRAHRKRRGW